MYVQQGDVLFFSTDALPEGAKKVDDLVIARGEATGHSHRFAKTSTAQMFMHDGTMFAVVGAPSPVVHEEHATVTLAPGVWQVGRVREFDPFEEVIRYVAD